MSYSVISVSVIVPVYKAELFFEKCLRSLFDQTLANIEYIFIDDSTPDASMKILNDVLLEYPERKDFVRVFTNVSNLGSGATRAVGMKLARGEYVIHCDSDDWCEPDMYEQMYKVAVSENADIVCCDISMEYIGRSVCNRYKYAIETRQHLLELKLDLLYSSLCNKLIRRSLYQEYNVSFFEDVNMWEDLGLMTRLRYFSKKTVIVSKALYHYNKQNAQSIASVPKVCKIEEQMRCASMLGDFFENKEQFSIVSDYLKFMAKSAFLYSKVIRDTERWKKTFATTHKFIWHYTNLSWEMRLEFWLASKGFAKFVSAIIDTKVYINSELQKVRC